ncbi:hypothetical protein [Streptosporangium sp. NPDC006930]|uniref:hypothetical protein n=1 Tax=Streptosporangium sp. NPDC006930 TaxID=3154783 RepID=UPI0034389B43
MAEPDEAPDQDARPLFADLQKLRTLRQELLRGKPSDRKLAAAATVSPTTIGAWLRGDRMPQRIDELLAMIEAVRKEAAAQGILTSTVAELLESQRWRTAYQAECRRRAHNDREAVQRAHAIAALEEQDRVARWRALIDQPHPVRTWTPRRLGVHDAISGTTSMRGRNFTLPDYILRPHDQELRDHLTHAATTTQTILVVLRGGSCTGKTRAATEAVAAVLSDWNLVFPKGADSLLAVLAARAAGPNTVLWLNDAQDLLYGTAGEAAAAALRSRLEHPGPTVIIATLWPSSYRELTAAPAHGSLDEHPHARGLLAQGHLIDLPAAFTPDLLAQLRVSADPSLVAAARSRRADITQILAAGPDLIDHYEHPSLPHGIYGKALITAAMDARRLGVNSPLPLAFLHDAVPGYLDDDQRAAAAPNWFTTALAYARTPVKNVVSALQNVPRFKGMGAQDNLVHLADYLQQHARSTRGRWCPPAPFWEAAVSHIYDSQALTVLAQAAQRRLRLRHAALLYQAAANAGNPGALLSLAQMLKDVGDQEGAERSRQTTTACGESGKPAALHDEPRLQARVALKSDLLTMIPDIAQMLTETQGHEGIKRLYRPVIASKKPGMPQSLDAERHYLTDQEREEQLTLFRLDAVRLVTLTFLAQVSEEDQNREQAEQMYQAVADSGGIMGLALLAYARERSGAQEEAERLALRVADAGLPVALRTLAELRQAAEDWKGAESVARQAADAGAPEVLMSLTQKQAEPTQQHLLRYGLEPDGSISDPW